MFGFLSGVTFKRSASFIADFFSVIFNMFGRTVVNSIKNVFAFVWNFITAYIWYICKWVLGVIDAMQFGFTRLLGIDTGAKTTMSAGDLIDGAKDIIISGGSNYYDYLMKIFRAVFGVAIVLMIVFTIFAMVMQEYNMAVNGYEKANNEKGKFVKVIFSNIITIFLIPLIFYTVITGTSAILTSFYRAMGTGTDVTIAGNVLAAATYDANRYRAYANANKRIPITIGVYSMENIFGAPRSDQEILESINDLETQEKLKVIAGAFAENSFLPFNKSTIYANGTWSNYENYSLTYKDTVYDDLGDYFENFICTREQYYIMADFIDYCQLYNIKYYVKAMSESDICWKYVDNLTLADIDDKGNALGDITLNVTYRNAETVNMEDIVSAANGESDSYSLQITTKMDMTSPISDALTTASKLLGIDENSSQFNTMERDESGDFTNLVSWATEKVLLKTSTGFNLNTPSTWNYSDQIIVYEYFHFQAEGESSNNTLQNYRLGYYDGNYINDFADGVTVNALELTYRNYNSNTQSYSKENKMYCVKLNGTYYRVYKSDTQFDDYGHAYYLLDAVDRNVKYFEDGVVKIEHTGTMNMQLSADFNINNVSSWTIKEQIIIYEYFKDLSLSNDLVKNYQLMDFKKTGSDAPIFNTYSITANGSTKSYVYINGTYYATSGLSGGANFLTSTAAISNRTFYYKLSAAESSKYGLVSTVAEGNPGTFEDIDDTDGMYQRYASMNFKLSEGFSFYNSDTWTFRDYVILSTYKNALMGNSNITVDSLKSIGLQGTYGRVGGTYYLEVKAKDDGTMTYLNLETLSRTSELKITQTLDPEIFSNLNLGLNGVNLVTTYSAELDSDRLVGAELETHTFEFSEEFDPYTAHTWSVGEYLMIYLTNQGIIDTSIELLRRQGYTALVYKIGGTKYYRFGKEGDANAFFLNGAAIEGAGYNIDKWFATDLMSLLVSKYYSFTTADLTYTNSSFGNNAYVNKDNYIYDFGANYTETKSLQYMLAKDIANAGFAIMGSETIEYSYSNPELVESDLTTWSYLDLAIYGKTGKLPTTQEPYTSFVYKSASTVWFLVKDTKDSSGDIYVNISSGRAACYSATSGIYTFQARSDKGKQSFSDTQKFNAYYKKYIITRDSIGTGTGCTVYFYSDLLKGSSGTATFEPGIIMSDLEMAMIYNGITINSNGYYAFPGYMVDGSLYIKLNNVYLGLSKSSSDKIYYIANSLIPDPNNAAIFTKTTDTYTSFEVDASAGTENFKQFDSIIYNIVSYTASKTYDIYKNTLTNQQFINVNDRFVMFDSTLAGQGMQAEPSESSAYVKYLYENFYSTYVSENAPPVKAKYSGTVSLINENKWYAGLSVILSYYGADYNSGVLIESTTNTKYFKVTSSSGKVIYINLSGIVEAVTSFNGSSYLITLTCSDVNSSRWRLLNTKKDADDNISEYATKFVSDSSTYLVSAGIIYQTVSSVEATATIDVSGVASNLSITCSEDDLISTIGTNFTYLNLLSSYYDPRNQYKKLNKYYSISTGTTYVAFQSYGEIVLVPETGFSVNGGPSCNITDSIFTGSGAVFTNGAFNNTEEYVVGKLIKQKGYDAKYNVFKSSYIKDENNNDIELYIVVDQNDDFKAIYGLKNDKISSLPITYKTIQGSTPANYSFSTSTDINDAALFTIKTQAMSHLKDWTMIDFAVAYTVGAYYGEFFTSEVYLFDGRNYLKYDDNKYILIPINSSNNLGDIFKATSSKTGEVIPAGSKKLLQMIFDTGFVVKYSTKASDFASFESGSMAESTSGRNEFIKLSEDFDIRDFSTWSISDYILYYVVNNDFYDGSVGFSIPFTYIPNFMSNGEDVYNITYLDLLLAGRNSADLTAYFKNPDAVYQLYLYRDSSYKYYLKADNHLISLSSIVYTDYANMEVKSPICPGTYSIGSDDELTLKFDEYKDNLKTYSSESAVSFTVDSKNFQTLTNSHGTLGKIHYLLKQNENTGSVEFDKVIEFSSSNGASGVYFKYNKFFELYGSSFANFATTIGENTLDISIGTSNGGSLAIDIKYNEVFSDLEFYNYYYFVENAQELIESGLTTADKTTVQNPIMDGTWGYQKAKVNLKLSSAFVDGTGANRKAKMPESVNDWTVIDYIILREYSRSDVNHNKFKDMSFDELLEDTYVDLYVNGTNCYMLLNGNLYNLTGVIKSTATGTPDPDEDVIYVADDSVKLSNSAYSGIIENSAGKSTGHINNYNIRVLTEILELSMNPDFIEDHIAKYDREANNISYKVGSVVNFRYIDTNIADANYRIPVWRYGVYSTEKLIKKVSWVEKLMTDMQVLYPDLNWGILIATDGWLDTLGDFTSAYTNGLFTGGNNSSNTTAAGLVLSELFMSVATKVEYSYADYEYSSVFDEDTLHSLMLSLVGEADYRALMLEAEVFMDFFNSSFAPIIDDFAKEFGEEIGENSLRLCAYKSYLATVLLSSDIGEYLYTIATRIYAEYTIGEYLANAGGDYAGYYGYVNSLKDENGDIIDAFNYGTFIDLVRYENQYCGNRTPTFTFNVKQAFDYYEALEGNDGDDLLAGTTYEQALLSESRYQGLISYLLEKIDEHYESIYSKGLQISEDGIVVDEFGDPESTYEDEEYIFCYMIHVYWSIKAEIGDKDEPSYLTAYKSYIDGELTRWSIYSDESIDGADKYFEDAGSYKSSMSQYILLTYVNAMRLYIPSMPLGGNEGEGFLDKITTFVDVLGDFLRDPKGAADANIMKPAANAYDMLEGNSLALKALEYVNNNSKALNFVMEFSADASYEVPLLLEAIAADILPADTSSETCWNTVLQFSDNIQKVVDELHAVRDLLPGETTTGGSNRYNEKAAAPYTDAQIDYILSVFKDLQYNVNQYITAQTRLDRMEKRSITFTLAQYGVNYVSTGYTFTVRHKNYTFKNTVDPSRIAEYVYGGDFLVSVGAGAQYTSPDFEGIVHDSKVYDNVDKVLKTNLETWPTLRRFASNLADKTAELYFLTNLGDLDVGKVNGITVSDCGISNEIASFISDKLTSYGMSSVVSRVTESGDNFVSLSMYLFSNEIDASELTGMTLEEYKRRILQKVIENNRNQEESAEEQAARYMTMLQFLGFEVRLSAGGKQLGRMVHPGRLDENGKYKTDSGSSETISASSSFSNSTIDVIKTMSGLENRPTIEALTKEYSGTRTSEYYDEAYGDTFIICTYKDGLYYPILTSGSKLTSFIPSHGAVTTSFYGEDGLLKHKFISEYSGNGSNVIVAKGIITPDGNPTAIRKYNNPIEISEKAMVGSTTKTYSSVTYYRTNIGGNFGPGKDLINASRAVSRVTTNNYTKYVYGTNFTDGLGSATTYTGKSNLKTFVQTDYQTNFVQSKVEYLMTASDEVGGISVIDEFSYFYLFGGQSWVLLMLAFITLIPVMINALGGVISRLFDIVVLFLVSPLVISTNSLFADGKNDIYKKWKKNVMSVAWSAIGYIIGFSAFALLIPLIYNVNVFVDVGTFKTISKIGGLDKIITYPLINGLVRSLWVITAVTILERFPKLLLPILTANYGDLAEPHPGLGTGSKKFTEKAKAIGNSVKDAAAKIGSVVSGKAAMGLVEQVKSDALGMIPGYELGKGLKERYVDPITDAKNSAKVQAEEKLLEGLLKSYGIDPQTAKKAAKAVGEAEKAKNDVKKKEKKRREEYRKEFEKLIS